MKPSEDPKDFILGLEDNAMDSLVHGIEHFMEGSQPTDLKYTVLHIFHAVELFLKARLAKAHPLLLYQKPEANLENAFTVDFPALLGRLHNLGVVLSKESIEDLKFVQRVRNSIEHHRIEAQRQSIEEYIARTLRFLEAFLEKELGIILKEHMRKEAYHTMAEQLYSFKERREKAQNEMKKHLPSDAEILTSKGLLTPSVVLCDECGQEAITIPDPTASDGTVHCFFCDARYHVSSCERCDEVMLSATPFNLEDALLCDNCWEGIMASDE